MSDKNTDNLIEGLCGDLESIKPRCPYTHIAAWFLGSLFYLATVVSYIGLRPDFDMNAMNPLYIFEIGLAGLILISASIASSWLSVPDCLQRPWIKIIPITLALIFTLWAVIRSVAEGMDFISGLHIGHCAQEGLLMEVIPLVALVFITIKSCTTQPYWSMVMNVLAVSTLGWIGLRLTCPVDEMGHSLFNHLLPFAILAAALGMFARKLFKW